MKKTIQIVIQILFLTLFILLIIFNKVQLWMGLFIFSVIATLLLGRFYCGWVCPINTVMKFVGWIKMKLHIRSFNIPGFLKKPWLRFVFLGFFIATFVLTLITGNKLPILPILFIAGIILSLFFSEELWHCYFCPYGTILSLPGTKSVHYLNINQDLCVSCGICKKVCTANSVKEEDKKYEIVKKDCLLCMKCSQECPQHAIRYK